MELKDYFLNIQSGQKSQVLILRRTLLAMSGAFVYTIVCTCLYMQGYFRTSLLGLILYFSIFWIGAFGFYFAIFFGWNKNFKEAGFTYPMMIWYLIFLLIGTYLTNVFRPLLLIFTLYLMMFGAFRLLVRQFLTLTIAIIASYIVIVYLLFQLHPQFVNLPQEYYSIGILIYVLFGCATLAWDMSRLRQHMKYKNNALQRALHKIELISTIDDLTQVNNRRYILDVLSNQYEISARNKDYMFSVCMFDVDFFKNVNDTYGHEIGDSVLVDFCREIKNHLRKTDYFGRFGGEEFILIAPFTNKEDTKNICNRIRESIENLSIICNGENIKMTTSIGISQYERDETIKSLLKRVDQALYKAKELGRNKVIVF